MSESVSARRAAELHGDINTARRGGRRVMHPPLFYTSSLNLIVKVLDFVKCGGPGRIRTCDQSVMSRPLLPLSYGPVSTSYSMP